MSEPPNRATPPKVSAADASAMPSGSRRSGGLTNAIRAAAMTTKAIASSTKTFDESVSVRSETTTGTPPTT